MLTLTISRRFSYTGIFLAQGVWRGIVAEKKDPRLRDSNSGFLLAKYCIATQPFTDSFQNILLLVVKYLFNGLLISMNTSLHMNAPPPPFFM